MTDVSEVNGDKTARIRRARRRQPGGKGKPFKGGYPWDGSWPPPPPAPAPHPQHHSLYHPHPTPTPPPPPPSPTITHDHDHHHTSQPEVRMKNIKLNLEDITDPCALPPGVVPPSSLPLYVQAFYPGLMSGDAEPHPVRVLLWYQGVLWTMVPPRPHQVAPWSLDACRPFHPGRDTDTQATFPSPPPPHFSQDMNVYLTYVPGHLRLSKLDG